MTRATHRIVQRRTDVLVPYERNPRVHAPEQIAQIATSISQFGFTIPVLIDGKNRIIAGHGRVLAAKQMGMGVVPCIVATDWSDDQKRAYTIADNKLTEGSTWDELLLGSELQALRVAQFDLGLTGFSPAELDTLMGIEPRGEQPSDDDEGADGVPDVPKVVTSVLGDVWLIGDHRLVCGDASDPDILASLMQGDHFSAIITSPPYGNQRNYTGAGESDWHKMMTGVFHASFTHATDDAQMLVNLGMIHKEGEWLPYWDGWIDWMRAGGWRRFGLYVWDQGPGLPGDWNGRLAPSFEFIFHFNRAARQANKITPCVWAGHVNSEKGGLRAKDGTVGEWTHAGQGVQDFRVPDNVVRVTRHKQRGIEVEHPAVFPVKLPEFLMQAFTNSGDVVFEPFSGSGTSLIAAQKTGRTLCAADIAPQYVDLAVLRWLSLFPDIQVRHARTGQTFADVRLERNPS